MEDCDDPAPLADFANDGRVVRILLMPPDQAPFRDPAFAVEHGVAELEDVAGHRLPERRHRPPPDIIFARVERVTIGAGVSQGLNRQAEALPVGDLLADPIACKLEHFLIQRWDRRSGGRRREVERDDHCDPGQHNKPARPRSTIHDLSYLEITAADSWRPEDRRRRGRYEKESIDDVLNSPNQHNLMTGPSGWRTRCAASRGSLSRPSATAPWIAARRIGDCAAAGHRRYDHAVEIIDGEKG